MGRGGLADVVYGTQAAMEPGLGDREWGDPHLHTHVAIRPQWSPVLETGNGPPGPGSSAQGAELPQWSPVLETGNGPPAPAATGSQVRRNGARSWRPGMDLPHQPPRVPRYAAMEPGLGDREWCAILAFDRGSNGSPPQWSPVLETGNGRPRSGARSPPRQPQWSPVLETGNGAGYHWMIDMDGVMPQWSPVLETGNGGCGRTPLGTAVRPQWSPVLETGNGLSLRPTAAGRSRRRNGARSWRPGMGRAAS